MATLGRVSRVLHSHAAATTTTTTTAAAGKHLIRPCRGSRNSSPTLHNAGHGRGRAVISTVAQADQVAPQIASDKDRGDEAFRSAVYQHPAVVAFRQRKSVVVSRTALLPQEEHRPYHLAYSTLAGPGMISPRPYIFSDEAAGSVLGFYRLGNRLAGHGGIVHGGVSAILLDECMCRASFARLPSRMAMTVKLDLEYKRPIAVDSTVLVRADTTAVDGRKAWVSATIEDVADGLPYVHATGLFIEPKGAASMPKLL